MATAVSFLQTDKHCIGRHAQFADRLRDELLNETLFTSLAQTRASLALWRRLQHEQPHSQIGRQTPNEFAQTLNPRRSLALRNAKGSAPAPVASTAHQGKSPRRKQNQSWIETGGNVSIPSVILVEQSLITPPAGTNLCPKGSANENEGGYADCQCFCWRPPFVVLALLAVIGQCAL
ncbi:hypothetical protein GCM10010869_28730 [Mesorhizobium tianshanense]|uniref:Integrase-like protein n=1 Tax=Mesorhizobium tianshanense TaxID=39844 RepID=A0A562MNQ2_9HYPH|nr:integrase-like protein [Mesorhizobium tianshanense]GLS37280.1 hypothetical protein GCM10010869_28730 [Mesorhizobium tianshanense]